MLSVLICLPLLKKVSCSFGLIDIFIITFKGKVLYKKTDKKTPTPHREKFPYGA